MKQIVKIIFIVLILGAPMFNGCKKKEEEKVILSEKTKLPEENPNLKNVVVRGDTLRLVYKAGTQKPTFKAGDIVVGAIGEGYLKKVISSFTRGDTVFLFTEQACLTDAIKKCEVETTFALMPEERKMGKLKIDTTFIDEKGKKYFIKILSNEFLIKPLPQLKEFKIIIPDLRIEVRDLFNNLAAFFACDTVIFTKSLNPDIKIKIGNFKVKEFRFIINTTDKIDFKNVQIGILSSISKEIEKMLISPIPLGKVVIMAGPVPIVFIFELRLYGGVKVDLQVESDLEISNNVIFTSAFSVGGKYVNGSWIPLMEGTIDGDADFYVAPSFSVDADCEGALKCGISAKLYGVAGPYVYLKPYQYNQLTYPPFDFRLGIGLGAGLGFKVEVLSWRLADFNCTFTDFRKELIHSITPPVNNPPNPPQIPSGPSSGNVNTFYEFSSSATDPDGDSVAIRFDWGDGNISDWSTFVPSGQTVRMVYSWSSPGTYYIKAQAKDKKGAVSDWSLAHGITITTSLYPFTIVLTWGEHPRDLDAHMWTPIIEGQEYHVYFGNKGSLAFAPYCSLDVDDVTGYGPEHITISRTFPGIYTYAVHHYAGDSTITTSGAKVEVYRMGSLIRTFNVPRIQSGYRWWWYVFDLDGTSGTIIPKNFIDSFPPRPWPWNEEKK